MRERLAVILAALTAAIVIALSAVFSLLHNAPGRNAVPGEAPQAVPQTEKTPSAAAGRATYDRLRCAGCHAIGGRGNLRSPLDGVGQRHSQAALRDWIIASDSVRPHLSASVARMKQSYRDLSTQELQELVEYLASLKTSPESR